MVLAEATSTQEHLSSVPPTWRRPAEREQSREAWRELIGYAARNLENSDRFGESLSEYGRALTLDYDRPFLPEVLTPFHGTELWEELNRDQRIFLSQVRYAAFYNRVSSLENLACESNSGFAKQLPKNADNLLRFYVNRETQEEYDHIWAFRNVSRAIELHHFGEPVFDTQAVTMDEQVNIRLFDGVRFLYRWMPEVMAMLTYTIRGLRNATLKTAEEAILAGTDLDKNLQQLTRMHFIDEARHTGMSYTVGKCMYEITNRSPLCTAILLRYLKKPQQIKHKLENNGYQEYIDLRHPVVGPRLLAHPILKSKAKRIESFVESGRVATPLNGEIAERYLMRCRKNLEYLPEPVRVRAETLLRAQPG